MATQATFFAMVMRFFLEIVASQARGSGYTSDKVCDFVAKSSTHSISRGFLAVIITALAQGWLHVIFTVCWQHAKFRKIHLYSCSLHLA